MLARGIPHNGEGNPWQHEREEGRLERVSQTLHSRSRQDPDNKIIRHLIPAALKHSGIHKPCECLFAPAHSNPGPPLAPESRTGGTISVPVHDFCQPRVECTDSLPSGVAAGCTAPVAGLLLFVGMVPRHKSCAGGQAPSVARRRHMPLELQGLRPSCR